MKKIALTLLLIITCIVGLTGCKALGEKYWEDTAKNAEAVFTSDNFNNVYDIKFNDSLNQLIDSLYSYKELIEVFGPMFDSAIYYAYIHYNDFLVVPQHKTNKLKGSIKRIHTKLENFSKALEDFLQVKGDYERFIDFTDPDEALSDIELYRLLKFKREYITVIESALELSEGIFEARRIGYYDFSDYTSQDPLVDENADCSLAVNATNLKMTKIAIKILREYNAKEMAFEYKNYWSAAKNFYEDTVVEFENGHLNISTDVKSNLYLWKNAYDLFILEEKTLLEVINIIDLYELSKLGNNANAYANKTGKESDEYYAKYYLCFYEKINILGMYVNGLFAWCNKESCLEYKFKID